MKSIKQFAIVILLLLCCKSFLFSQPAIIDPGKFTDKEINLSAIADDITYIPLDNSVPAQIYPSSINILENAIFVSARNVGIIRFNRDGSNPTVIGKQGRGPGEWKYCMWIAADARGEKVYLMDADNDIKVYGSNGNFIKSLQLPRSEDGYNFSGISMFGSRLFAAEFINMGHGNYNWIVLDTDGKIISHKLNPIPLFKCNLGISGGIYRFEDKISYWNAFNDTVYSISPDLSYKAAWVFQSGDGKLPLAPVTSGPDFADIMGKYYIPTNLIETKRFLFYKHSHGKAMNLALIEKKSGNTYLIHYPNVRTGGLKNDLDGGLPFDPVYYFTEGDREYLVSIIEPLALKKHVSSESFNNTTARSELKKSLQSLSNKITETDNQILMVVRVK